MITDLQRFIENEQDFWKELEEMLDRMEQDPAHKMDVDGIKRFNLLYQRASADLANIMTYSSKPEILRYLESLTARAYANIHEIREKPHIFSPLKWFFQTFPQTFRRRILAFALSIAVTLSGGVFGGLALTLDPEAKQVLLPFPHLGSSPSERVSREEKKTKDELKGKKSTGAAWYMTHNTKVSILVMAMGITYGIGTILLLFYNGLILGAVVADYFISHEAEFLIAWLSPHGAVEIPAVLIAGQAGIVLAGALIGWGSRTALQCRLREISKDLLTLISGVALMLVWAGFIEAFISQYHEPVLPYSFKTGFAVFELALLILLLAGSGRNR